MRAARRRSRTADPLADPSAIRGVCEDLRTRLPDLIPASEKGLMRFFYAVRHVERRPATDTRKGRPPRWPREKLVKAVGQLRAVLERETGGRVSLSSFIGQSLPVLEFPSDVTDALASGQLNLQETAQLRPAHPGAAQLLCALSARAQGRTPPVPPSYSGLPDAPVRTGQGDARRIEAA